MLAIEENLELTMSRNAWVTFWEAPLYCDSKLSFSALLEMTKTMAETGRAMKTMFGL
jgi:hypothetical protein